MVLSPGCSGARIGSICQSAPIVLLMISLKCVRYLWRCRTLQPTRPRLRRWAMFRRHFELREMTKHAEHAMHTVVLSCTRARKQTLAASPLSKAVLH